jgi:hypothetical protein
MDHWPFLRVGFDPAEDFSGYRGDVALAGEQVAH